VYFCVWCGSENKQRLFPWFLGAYAKLRKASISLVMSVRPSVRPSVCPSFCPPVRMSVHLSSRPYVRPSVRPSVCPSICPPVRLSVLQSAWNNSAPVGRVFTKFYICIFFENLSAKFKFYLNRTQIRSILHKDRYTCTYMISRLVLLRMKTASDESCRETRNIYFIFSNFFFFVPFMS
jgi:hypothetical protein